MRHYIDEYYNSNDENLYYLVTKEIFNDYIMRLRKRDWE